MLLVSRGLDLLSFPELHIIDLTGAKVDALEVDLCLACHIDVGTIEAMFFTIDG